jgi:hypothetical protein
MPLDGRQQEVAVASSRPYSSYLFTNLRTGFDTLRTDLKNGLALDFIQPGRTQKDSRDRIMTYTTDCFNALEDILGPPEMDVTCAVSFHARQCDMPGILTGPMGSDDDFIGGLYHSYGQAVARQWFPRAASGLTHRETWILDAFTQYAAIMIVQHEVGSAEFYRNLIGRRNSVFTAMEKGDPNTPLAAGGGTSPILRVNKGICLVHMLRWLLYDLDRQSEDRFIALVRDVSNDITKPEFTNQSFVTLVEKHYGGSLQSFFKYWLYGTGIPDYDVAYSVKEIDSDFYVVAEVEDRSACGPEEMPVMIRLVLPDRNEFTRVTVRGPRDTVILGPYETKPAEFHFNEFLSLLAKVDQHEM